jgi:hypothetical protein
MNYNKNSNNNNNENNNRSENKDVSGNRVIPCQINTGHNMTPSEVNNFCEIVVPLEISVPAKILLLYGH